MGSSYFLAYEIIFISLIPCILGCSPTTNDTKAMKIPGPPQHLQVDVVLSAESPGGSKNRVS